MDWRFLNLLSTFEEKRMRNIRYMHWLFTFTDLTVVDAFIMFYIANYSNPLNVKYLNKVSERSKHDFRTKRLAFRCKRIVFIQ